jgi:hypothetical protein
VEEKAPTLLTHRSRIPPPRKRNTPLIVGIILIIILIIGVIVFFLSKGTSTKTTEPGKEKKDTAKASPTPTPSLNQLITIEISEQQASLSAINNDIKVLDLVFKDKQVVFSDILTPTPPQTAEWQAQKIEIARARAELEVTRRITALNKLIPKINSTKKLSTIQKSQLVNEVVIQASSASSLKEVIIKQTNFEALVANVNTLSESYKSYSIIVPKMSVIVIADKINVLGDSFTKNANKLIKKTDDLRKSKKDVTTVEKTLGHMLFMMGDAENKAEVAQARVFPLFALDSKKDRSVLLDARGKLQKSRQNLLQAVSDEKKIINSLSDIESGKSSQFNLFQLFNP